MGDVVKRKESDFQSLRKLSSNNSNEFATKDKKTKSNKITKVTKSKSKKISKSKKAKSSNVPKTKKSKRSKKSKVSKSQNKSSKSCKSGKVAKSAGKKSKKSDKSGKSEKCNPDTLPTISPSKSPTKVPTKNPSSNPTGNPSDVPTISQKPSVFPTDLPTLQPSSTPTAFCFSERGRIETILKVAESISGADVTGTPQVEALKWITNLDPLPNVCDGGEEQTEVSQMYVLAVFYYSTSGDDWNDNSMWVEQNENVCDWYGIECNSNRTVLGIKLEENNLVGELPQELASISTLSNILLFSNELNGFVPDVIFSLELGKFDVEENMLSGDIFPDKLFVNSAETVVDYLVSKNKFSGTIPTDVGKLLKLERFWVADNDLTGTIPSELANVKGLKDLIVYENSFSGSFPPGLFLLEDLTIIKASNNTLMEGPLPKNIDSKKLVKLEIDNSGLTGKLPTNLGDLTSLQVLFLENNSLTGTIPDLDDMRKLANVTFNDNELTGTMPSWNVAESNLKDIWLERNQLTGAIPGISSDNLPEITEILISDNCLTGSVPDSICIKREEYSDFKSLHVDCQPPKGSDTPRNQCAKDCCTSCFVGGVGCS